VISDLLLRAIQEAYKGSLMVGKYPFFVLYIELDPSAIDFNVHPKKLHIRFENDDYIYNKVYNVIRDFIEETIIQQEAKYIPTEISDFISKKEDTPQYNEEMEPNMTFQSTEIKKETMKGKDKSKDLSNLGETLVNESVQLPLTEAISEVNQFSYP
jgi:DNA mismatch repair protein MutL